MISLQNKTALVTGSSRGLGQLLARSLASRGCDLILHSRNSADTTQLRHELAEYGVDVHTIACDLADATAVEAMADELIESYPAIDLLFNNAGVQIRPREQFWQTPAEDYALCFGVNCTAPALLCHRILPKMLAAGFGRVVNVTSGIAGEPQQPAYSASKAALDKFTLDLAGAIPRGNVLVNLVDPGWCSTDMGGYSAPNKPDSAVNGLLLGALVDDGISGRIFDAQACANVPLDEAVARASNFATLSPGVTPAS